MKRTVLILSLLISFNAFAETSGTCGPRSGSGTDDDPYVYADNCKWTLDENGKLTITGTGEMGYHEYYDAPWGHDITEVSISGISSISSLAFVVSPNLTKVDISDSVTTIGAFPFEGDWGLNNISLPSSITYLGEGVFSGTSVTTLIIPDSLMAEEAYFSKLALANSYVRNLICSSEKQSDCSAYLENALEYYTPEGYTGGWPPPSRPLSNKPNISIYIKDGNEIFYNNHWYESLKDITSGNYIKKRIYTIDEAEKLSKKTGNTFRLRYK
ncbi:MAG: leucine-rich repeat protein [Alphaproteobacteria bacterium]|nr:leucine-rich repeat protein [Alphaproteobacteria bacterium]